MSTTKADVYSPPESDLGSEIIDTHSGLFSFKGRLCVLGYMARSAILMLCIAVVAVIYIAFASSDLEAMTIISTVILGLAILPLVWIGVALMAKRLHDIDMSGWWILVTLVPVAGMLFTLYISLLPGSAEDNHYGKPIPVTGWEKPVGIVGIILTVTLIGASVLLEIRDFIS